MGINLNITSQPDIIIIIILSLIARKLTFEYDQMRVTSKIPENYK